MQTTTNANYRSSFCFVNKEKRGQSLALFSLYLRTRKRVEYFLTLFTKRKKSKDHFFCLRKRRDARYASSSLQLAFLSGVGLRVENIILSSLLLADREKGERIFLSSSDQFWTSLLCISSKKKSVPMTKMMGEFLLSSSSTSDEDEKEMAALVFI